MLGWTRDQCWAGDGNYSADKSSDQSSPRNPVTLGPDYLVSPSQRRKYQEKRGGDIKILNMQ